MRLGVPPPSGALDDSTGFASTTTTDGNTVGIKKQELSNLVMMKIIIPFFELLPGQVTCLHIPHDCTFQDEIVEDQIAKLAISKGITVTISKPAGWESKKRLPLELTSADWLSSNANISPVESKKIISSLGEKLSERVAEKLAWNAGTPRCLLGIAATMARNPEILAYSTVALDPEGVQSVHKFVVMRCRHICVIHISFGSVYGDGSPHPRICPPGARCVEATENNEG
jgi:hypothetical protein